MTEWISVEDQLPSKNKWVLAYAKTYKDSSVYAVVLLDSEWNCWVDVNTTQHFLCVVTHWMPMPDPPSGD